MRRFLRSVLISLLGCAVLVAFRDTGDHPFDLPDPPTTAPFLSIQVPSEPPVDDELSAAFFGDSKGPYNAADLRKVEESLEPWADPLSRFVSRVAALTAMNPAEGPYTLGLPSRPRPGPLISALRLAVLVHASRGHTDAALRLLNARLRYAALLSTRERGSSLLSRLIERLIHAHSSLTQLADLDLKRASRGALRELLEVLRRTRPSNDALPETFAWEREEALRFVSDVVLHNPGGQLTLDWRLRRPLAIPSSEREAGVWIATADRAFTAACAEATTAAKLPRTAALCELERLESTHPRHDITLWNGVYEEVLCTFSPSERARLPAEELVRDFYRSARNAQDAFTRTQDRYDALTRAVTEELSTRAPN